MSKIILIVEDEPKNLKFIRDLLQVSGYTTIEASNGREGVALAKEKKPDLILMDIYMPVMDGLEATRILKSDATTKDIPIVALTASAMAGDEEMVFEACCNGYITKPIYIKKFLRDVEDYLSR